MDWKSAKRKLLKNKGRQKAYEKVDLAYEIGNLITDARIAKNMTQQNLAELVGTKQSGIARLERGNTLPSLSLLQKVANAFETQLLPPRFQFLEEAENNLTIYEEVHLAGYEETFQPQMGGLQVISWEPA